MSNLVRLRAGSAVLGAAALGASVLGPVTSAQAITPSPTFSVGGSVTGLTADSISALDQTGDSAGHYQDVDATLSNGTYSLSGLDPARMYLICSTDYVTSGTGSTLPEIVGCYGGSDINGATSVSEEDAGATDLDIVNQQMASLQGSVANVGSRSVTVQIERQADDGTWNPFVNPGIANDGAYSVPVTAGRYKIGFTDDNSTDNNGDPDPSAFPDQFIGAVSGDDASPAFAVSAGATRTVEPYSLRYHSMRSLTDDNGNGAPTITGTPQVGQTLHATSGSWTPQCTAPTFTYTWMRSDSEQPVHSGSDYQLTAADLDHSLQVMVTGTSNDCVTQTSGEDAAAFAAVDSVQPAPAPTPTIIPAQPSFDGATVAAASGKPKVGGTLAAPSLPNLPADAQISYQWFQAVKVTKGHRVVIKAIRGATRPTVKLSKKQKGSQVFVTLTVRSASYAHPAKVSSKKVRVH